MKTKDIIEIVNSAPDDATHWAADTYLKVDGNHVYCYNGLGVWSVPISNVKDVFIHDNPLPLSILKMIKNK